ncbi:MAG: glycosyltransferase [Porcipelethomonas sp.]
MNESRYLRFMKKPVQKEHVFEFRGQHGCMKELAVSGFVIAGAPLPDYYIKRDGQTVVSKFVPEKSVFIGKTQRTLLMSDFIITGSESEKSAVLSDFGLGGIYEGSILCGSREELVKDIVSGMIPDGERISTDRRKVLLYGGSLAQNGLTSSLLNLLSRADRDDTDIRITWREDSIRKHPENIKKIPPRFGIVPICGRTAYSTGELICYILYFKFGVSAGIVRRKLDIMYKREWKRLFGPVRFDCAVHFTGYEYGMINLFRAFEGRRVIYVHNNMKEEIRLRKNQHEPTLRRAYSEFEVTALVTEDMRESAMEISGGKGNMQVVPNCHDYKGVTEKSMCPVEFQPETESSISSEKLTALLDSSRVKFITIGRFSAEKAHFRLIEAFEEYCREYDDTTLIIIGGRGELFEETLRRAEESEADIVLIRSMENPMPVLRKCGLFMLPSLYEGLGLVLLEADTLGVPVFATDIAGPGGFMREHGGFLAENSRQGIVSAMKMFREGKITALKVDYEEYNRKAVQAFYEII